MAQGSKLALALVLAVVAMVSTFAPTVVAQDLAPVPAPSMDKGAAAYSAPVSGAIIWASLFLSILALLKH